MLEPSVDSAQRLGVEPVSPFTAIASFVDEARASQDTEMPGYRRTTDAEFLGDLSRRQLGIFEKTKDRSASWIGDRAPDGYVCLTSNHYVTYLNAALLIPLPRSQRMLDIMSDFSIRATAAQVFRGVASPAGLDTWWTKKSSGKPRVGESYSLDFGADCVWRAVVAVSEPSRAFALVFTEANAEWVGTTVRFRLEQHGSVTRVEFEHTGWPGASAEYRASCYCWQMYLRLLRRNLEHGEFVPYAERLDA